MFFVRWFRTTLFMLLIAGGLFGQTAESSPLRMAATSSQEWLDPDVPESSALLFSGLTESSWVPIPVVPFLDAYSDARLAPAQSDPLGLEPRPPLLLAPLDGSPLIHATSLVAGETAPFPDESADSSSTPMNHRIPEPGSYLLLLTGIIGLLARRRLRSRSNLPDSPSEPGPV